MVTGKCNQISVYFYKYQLELLIPPYNTMLKLLIILFVIKLYARIDIFKCYQQLTSKFVVFQI